MPIFLPALAGLAGYLMSNPRRRKHRRRRNPATAKDVRRLQLLENEYIVAKNRYENRRPRDDAAKLKREMTEARIRHRFFWGHAADEPRGYVFRARRNPGSKLGDTAKFLRRNLREAMQPLWALEAAVVTAKREHDDRALYIIETAIKALKTTAKNLTQAERIAWDAVVALETRQNPKRRRRARKVKVRRKVKGKWRTVTTITKTVRRVKTNPEREVALMDAKRHGLSADWRITVGYHPASHREVDPQLIRSLEWKRAGETYWHTDESWKEETGRAIPKKVREFARHHGVRPTMSNPGLNLRSPNRLISHGHYFVHDKEAGALVRMYGNGKLPKHGYEQKIVTPEGEFYINRTPIAYDTRFKTKRGWVWCVY